MGLVASPLGGLLLAVGGFILLGIALTWGLSPTHKHRRPQLFAALATAAVIFLLNMIARASGIWQWYGYQLPLVVQLGMLFALPAVLFIGVLAGFRKLVTRSRRPLLVYGLTAACVLVPVTVAGDLYSVSRGTLSFGRGYTLLDDILVGQALIWLPVLLYLLFLRIGHNAAA